MIPPGIDVAGDRRRRRRRDRERPVDRARAVVARAKGHRARVAACEGLDVDLEIVEGLHHDEAFERYRARRHRRRPAQRGLVRPLRDRVRWRSASRSSRSSTTRPSGGREEAFGDRRCRSSARRRRRCASALRPLVARRRRAAPRRRRVAAPTSSACTTSSGSPTACSTSTLGSRCRSPAQLKRLGKHSVDLRARRARLADPRRPAAAALHALPARPSDYGAGRDARRARRRCSTIVLRFGISSAFFRFYFDADDPAAADLVVRTSFWFTMAMATLGLVARRRCSRPQISHCAVRQRPTPRTSCAPALVGLWAQMNYEQLTSLFRVEERSVAFVFASLANVADHRRRDGRCSSSCSTRAPIGVIVGNFTRHARRLPRPARLPPRAARPRSSTAAAPRDEPLRACRSSRRRSLLWVTNFADRFFLVKLTDTAEVGLYSVGVRIASAMVLAAHGLPDRLAGVRLLDRERRRGEADVRVRAHVPRRHLVVGRARARRCSRRGSSHWLTDARTSRARRASSARSRSRRCRSRGYIVLAIGVGRARRTQFNWVVTGSPAPSTCLNLGADPALRDDGRRRSRPSPPTSSCSSGWRGGAARLPGAVPVAPRRDRRGRRASRSPSPASSPDARPAVAVAARRSPTRSRSLPLGFYLPAERTPAARAASPPRLTPPTSVRAASSPAARIAAIASRSSTSPGGR